MPKLFKYLKWSMAIGLLVAILSSLPYLVASFLHRLSDDIWGGWSYNVNPFLIFGQVTREVLVGIFYALWLIYLTSVGICFRRALKKRGPVLREPEEPHEEWKKRQLAENWRSLRNSSGIGLVIPLLLYVAPLILFSPVWISGGLGALGGLILVLCIHFPIYWGLVTILFIWGTHKVPVRLLMLIWDLRCPRPAA